VSELEDRSNKFELCVAALLGVAAVLAAFAALRSSMLGDEVLSGYTLSTQDYNDAIGYEAEDTQRAVQDQQLFLRYAEALNKNETEWATELRTAMFEPSLEQAVTWWEDKRDSPGAPTTPFDEGSPYELPFADKVDELYSTGDDNFNSAKRADDRGDSFDLAAAILAITLFAGGLASLLQSGAARASMIAVAVASLLFATGFVIKGQFG
jgi:hypothetical protein